MAGATPAAGLTKADSGTLKLSAANTYTGATSISAGTLHATNNRALGDDLTTRDSTDVVNGVTLLVSGGLSGLTDPIFLNGPGVGDNGSLRVQGTNTLSGLVTLSTSSEIGADSGATLTLAGGVSGTNVNVTFDGAGDVVASGAISLGTGNLVKQGSGVATLSSASNSYSGTTTVTAGTLRLSGSGSVPDGSAVSVTGTLDLNNVSDTVGSITGAGNITLEIGRAHV